MGRHHVPLAVVLIPLILSLSSLPSASTTRNAIRPSIYTLRHTTRGQVFLVLRRRLCQIFEANHHPSGVSGNDNYGNTRSDGYGSGNKRSG
ncbi:hypothetical protein K439DRAFT_1637379 [Ramaria rubella]|nr:hypothetical protein K439DRAFT_1640680 [Ramaria rubella]KAF8580035.1 hypothetical protein K439DRAFT_1637379 [Ramaria rubella]